MRNASVSIDTKIKLRRFFKSITYEEDNSSKSEIVSMFYYFLVHVMNRGSLR